MTKHHPTTSPPSSPPVDLHRDLAPEELLTHRGHDAHFLTRLERVSSRATDLALRLYREPGLVCALLEDSAVPPTTERIAIAIAPGEAPPFVVVTRQGRFVTCLGPGMYTGRLPILAWERLAIHLQRADREVSRVNLAVSTLNDRGSGHLVRQLVRAGARLPREDFQQLVVVQPLIEDMLVDEMFTDHRWILREMYKVVRIKRPKAEAVYLRSYWDAIHRLGHLLLLTSHEGPRSFELIERKFAERGYDPSFGPFDGLYIPLMAFGYGPLTLRALWAMGRAGKLALPSLKRLLTKMRFFGTWCLPAFGLVAIALRHQRFRAEILGAFNVARLPEAVREAPWTADFLEVIHKLVNDKPLNGDEGPVKRQAAARVLGGGTLDELAGRPRRSEEELVADELALPRLANYSWHHVKTPMQMHHLLTAIVSLAGQPAEEFYLPASHVNDAPPFSPEAAAQLAQIAPRPPGPVRAEDRPGRNEPCSCGSGKKYKRCCGSVGRSGE